MIISRKILSAPDSCWEREKIQLCETIFLTISNCPVSQPAMVRMSASARRKSARRRRDNHRRFSFLYRGAVLGEAFLMKQEHPTAGFRTSDILTSFHRLAHRRESG